MLNPSFFRLLQIAICILAVSFASDVHAQSVSITSANNVPTWTSGDIKTITYNWSGVSQMWITIESETGGDNPYFEDYVIDSNSPVSRAIQVPDAISGQTTECVLILRGLNVMSQVVCTSATTVYITTP